MYIFLSQYIFSLLLFLGLGYLYFLVLALTKKQKKDHEHVLKNLKYLGSLIEHYFKNEK